MGRFKQLSTTLLIVVVLALLGTSGFIYKKYIDSQKQVNELKDPQKAIQQGVKDLVDKIGKLVVLPEGEDPTVATVSDPDKLKDQAFFAQAQKDDKVLIYAKAKKAYLYNPLTNRVVEIAPLSIGSPITPTPTPTPAATRR